MNSRYASGKYRFEIRLSEEVPEGLYYRKIKDMNNTHETPSPFVAPSDGAGLRISSSGCGGRNHWGRPAGL